MSSLVPRPLPDRFYLAAVEKNQEKAWDQNYITDQKWWTRLVQTESTLLRGAWEGPGNKATTFPQSDAAATTLFTVCLVRLLIEASYYSRAEFISLGSRQIATTTE